MSKCKHHSTGTTTREVGKMSVATPAGATEVSTFLVRPPTARWLLVLGHGAGVSMRHPFMEGVADHLADRGIASFRYQFPYMEHRRRVPDRRSVLISAVRRAVDVAARVAANLPLLAGGKSLGGRMTSLAMAEEPRPDVRGIVFFGFPLHPARQPTTERAEHLALIQAPMLFLQGTRDDLADLDRMRVVCKSLEPLSTLHVLEDADHSFNVLKRTGRTQEEIQCDLASAVDTWTRRLP